MSSLRLHILTDASARSHRCGRTGGFTLIELLAVISILVVLSVMTFGAARKMLASSARAADAATLRQLAVAGVSFGADNDRFWKDAVYNVDGGNLFWFGHEAYSSMARGEGNREYDPKRSPLAPYMDQQGQAISSSLIAIGSKFKPKYRSGYLAVGYNSHLGGLNIRSADPNWVMFATSAQVNTFQSPASVGNPMLEEFYLLYRDQATAHFRHGGKTCLIINVAGNAHFVTLDPSTQDTRLPLENVGKLPVEFFPPPPEGP